MQQPDNAEDLAEELRRQALHDRTVCLQGNGSKHLMAGPIMDADEQISTRGLRQILDYEPNDLTISVEAGVRWRELTELLARNRQMVPLDPPFAQRATVGGVVAANCSGPRRGLYGSARDLVIGMKFATMDGKLVNSGGMVVKNVAGLDMAKLMIGSFGTLAAIMVVNFKLAPMPEVEHTFLAGFDSAADALAARDRMLGSGLLPAALDLWNPAASRSVAERAGMPMEDGDKPWTLAVRASGNAAAMARFRREAVLQSALEVEGGQQADLWQFVEEFTPYFLESCPNGAVVRASCTLKELEEVAALFPGAAIARAGSGVCYGYFEESRAAAEWMETAKRRGWKAVIEFASDEDRTELDMWPHCGGDFELMQRVKRLFDPGNLLNRGRLYRLI